MRELNTMEDFTRDINYRVLVRDDEAIVLTGILKDRFHDIKVDIIVDGHSLEIIDSEVVFKAAPSLFCNQVEERVKLLIGITIGKGLSRNLMTVLGGKYGCGNLRTLLAGLLPLALNVNVCAGISDEQEMLDTIHQKLQGTCIGYPADKK